VAARAARRPRISRRHPSAGGRHHFQRIGAAHRISQRRLGSEFFIANLSAPKPSFRHSGRLDEGLSRWIKTRLVSNPTCLLASTVDVFVIIDSQMRYSVVGAPPEIIEKFEKRFGGATAVQSNFTNYVDQMRIGSGLEDVKWAQDYLQKWSGWY